MARKRPPWRFPDNAERDYMRVLVKTVQQLAELAHRAMGPRYPAWLAAAHTIHVQPLSVRTDDYSSEIDAVLEQLEQQGGALADYVVVRLPTVFAMVNTYNDIQFRQIVKAGTGVTLPTSRATLAPTTGASPVGIDLYRTEPWLADLQANWVAQNTSLIRSMTGDSLKRIETIVRQGVMGGTVTNEVANQLGQAVDISAGRAKLIAQDQIGKANAALSEYRMRSVGVKEYYWRTLEDSRVRPSHREREGKVFAFAHPPEDGNPGYPVRCRCYAEPKWPHEGSDE
ncbi:MAG: minor capsid protein [Paraburkholderia sp.]|jgi:SPP1 gp7 family putative phage head morphogenesis protein|nr:minor capsid protein [Paraburkholderia sp.]